jgi:hypothetical protein
MPPERAVFRTGDRVTVIPEYHWASGAAATVAAVPSDVATRTPDWREYWRPVMTRQGKEIFYWVIFDEPQIDADGDGPYNAAEIPGTALTRAM